MIERPADHREFIRILFKTDVEVFVEGRVLRSDQGVNISMRGMHFSVVDPALPGAPCRVVVRLNNDDLPMIIEAKGKIVRSEPGNLAVEFTELDLDGYHHLRQLILLNADDPEKAEQEFTAHWGIRRPAL
jgi:hypothetical protein